MTLLNPTTKLAPRRLIATQLTLQIARQKQVVRVEEHRELAGGVLERQVPRDRGAPRLLSAKAADMLTEAL
jgi:hypothetical protein